LQTGAVILKKRRILLPVKTRTERRIIIEKDEKGIRAALTEDGEASEFLDHTSEHESAAGFIYVGLVEGVHKNGFAFVQIGHERNAFLNLNDNKDAPAAGSVKAGRAAAVQVSRDAFRDKGAYVTTKLTWPGRFFVIEQIQQINDIEQGQSKVSISKKITSETERERLMRIASELLERIPLPDKSIIIRTDAASGGA
jgi:Rne/Rng family ribonuclease